MNRQANSSILELELVSAQFNEAVEIFKSINSKIISLSQSAELRVKYGKDFYFSKNGNWTKEAFIYAPRKGVFLTKNSPIIKNANDAVQAHKNKSEYFLTDEQVEEALINSIRVFGINISTKKFKDNEITVFAFGDLAEKYGNFLYELGVKEMPINLTCFSDKPFARQMYFNGFYNKSALNSIGTLFSDYKLCGMKNLK